MLENTGPLTNRKRPFAGGLVFFENISAGDIRGHQVRRELNAIEVQLENPRQRADHERLGQPRHAHEQAMPAREHGGEEQFDHLVLADDDLMKFLQQACFDDGETLDELGFMGIDCRGLRLRH